MEPAAVNRCRPYPGVVDRNLPLDVLVIVRVGVWGSTMVYMYTNIGSCG